MALRFSTGLRNAIAGLQATVRAAKVGATLALVDGGTGADSITNSGSDFITLGFTPGDILYVSGCTTAANDAALTGVEIQTVEAGTITLPTGSVNTAEAGAAGTVIAVARGGSLRDLMKDGVMQWYSGTIPTSPDAAPTGTLLATFTVDGGAWTAGSPDNGLEFGDAASAVLSLDLPSGSLLRGEAVSGGTVSWFRIKSNVADADGVSTTAYRIDGTVGTTTAYDCRVGTTVITNGDIYFVSDIDITFPVSA